ncbi:hypothetical protein V1517DRAFT_329321 [Lipomyces orientalis]|uniref:Uncharacterized protein n=1 Tax=Lipomyces orientalis TaxID=1233043 RepID=A0ACC3TGY3_9ASCO
MSSSPYHPSQLSPADPDKSTSDNRQSANSSGSRKRARARVPISCTLCRRKKLKCDKGQPCSNCITRHTTPSCSYAWQNTQNTVLNSLPNLVTSSHQSPGSGRQLLLPSYERSAKIPLSFTPDKHMATREASPAVEGLDNTVRNLEVDELKRRLVKMESAVAAMSNGLAAPVIATPTVPREAPLALQSVLAQNTQQSVTTPKPEVEIKKNRMSYFGPLSSLATVMQDPYLQYLIGKMDSPTRQKFQQVHSDFIRAAVESSSDPSPSQRSMDNSHLAKKARMQQADIMQQVLSNEVYNVNAERSEMFPRLSDRNMCELLIDEFMQSVNKVFPFVNPCELRAQVATLWETKQETSESAVSNDAAANISRKEFLRLTALITMAVRLGCLSRRKESSGSGVPSAAQFGRHLEQYAWRCLRETNYLAKGDITTVQILLSFRIHMFITPEVGDGIDLADASGIIGLLSQAAVTIGLHRDPDLFRRVTPGLTRMWRLLWSEIVFQDTDRALDLSVPFSIHLELSDTDLEKLLPFDFNVPAIEKPSLTFLHSKIKWCTLSRSILSRLLQPNLILSSEEFNSYYQQLSVFEESYLSSFHILLQMFHADPSASVSGPQDSYDLTQKFYLQLQFLRLRQVLLNVYSPPTTEERESVRKLRTRCALTVLDTLVTCLRSRQLFSRFMWLVVPLTLRHYHYAIVLIGSDIIRISLDNPESVSRQDLGIGDGSWATPDLSYRYQDEDLVDLRRLYQAYMKTYELVISYSDEYYAAYRSGLLLSLFNEYIKDQLTIGSAIPKTTISTPSSKDPIKHLEPAISANWDSFFSAFDSLECPDWWNSWSSGLSFEQMIDQGRYSSES